MRGVETAKREALGIKIEGAKKLLSYCYLREALSPFGLKSSGAVNWKLLTR